MARMLLALTLLLLTPLAARAEPVQVVLAPDAEARWVAFERTPHNQIRFAMTINGHAAHALLDTGISDSVVSAEFARVAGLRGTVDGQALASGGQVPIRWAAGGDLAIGGLRRSGGRIAIADLGRFAGGDSAVDALIGSDLLACCALEIDYDARRFRILPSGRMPFRGEIAPLRLARETSTYVTELTLAGRRLRPILVDTGDGSSITLARSAWAASGYRPQATTSTIAYGLGGTIETEVAIVPELRVDELHAREVEVRVEGDDGFSARVGTAGRIGSGFLMRYRVRRDPRAGRMVFAPGIQADAPPVRSTSGLLLGYERGRLRVLHVMRNSPADESGWAAGDLICASDGRPVRETVSAEGLVAWAVGAPGRTVRLTLCDGRERMLTLRRFY